MSLRWDTLKLLDHRKLIARMPRCKTCLVRVPLPASNGECVYCLRRAAPNGARITPIRPAPAPDALDIPSVDGDGSVIG